MTDSGDGRCDHLYKVVLVGDATVGKTHLLSRYVKGTLPKAPTATIGVEFATRTIPLSIGGTVKAQIWDTAGQERYLQSQARTTAEQWVLCSCTTSLGK